MAKTKCAFLWYASHSRDWTRKLIFAQDGGGIRGYSSLLVIQKLMDYIVAEELEQHKRDGSYENGNEELFQAERFSSYDPLPFPSDPSVIESSDSDDDLKEIEYEDFIIRRWLSKRRKAKFESIRERTSGSEMNGEKGNHRAVARTLRSKYLPCHYFDYMCGTSTGGYARTQISSFYFGYNIANMCDSLIAILLSRLRMSIDEALEQYEVLGGYIFGRPRIFSIRGPIPFPRDKYSDKRFVKVVRKVVENCQSRKKTHGDDHYFNSHERMCKTFVSLWSLTDGSANFQRIAVAFQGRKNEDETATEIQPPYLFRSYDHHPNPNISQERNPGYSQRVRIWQVARATTAAPTFFDCITIDNCRYGDGGFGANNPIREVYHEVCQMNGNTKKCLNLLMSVGTGKPKRVGQYDEGSILKYVAFLKVSNKLAADSERAHLERESSFAMDDTYRVPYHRFNVPYKQPKIATRNDSSRQPPITFQQDRVTRRGTANPNDRTKYTEPTFSTKFQKLSRRLHRRLQCKPTPLGDMKLDEWRPTTLSSIRDATDRYLSDPAVSDDLRTIAKGLVSTRRDRSQTIHWDLYSTGTEYRCMHGDCIHVKAHKMRPHARNLVRHLTKSHGIYSDGEVNDLVLRGRCEY